MPDQYDLLESTTTPADYTSYQDLLPPNLPWTFSSIPGYFHQSLAETDDTKFDYLRNHFGAIGSWPEIVAELDRLNAEADANTVYKILILARHGQGSHNMAQMRFGNKLWNEHYSKLNGDGSMVWGPDPLLTELGLSQARDNHDLWESEISRGAPIPSKWYVSPMSRSIDTLIHTWTGIVDLEKVRPLIMENLRETTGVHTCDKRSPRHVIAAKYPYFRIEDGFSEEDRMYRDDYRETVSEISVRMNLAFQAIFSDTTKNDGVLCITSHSGAIRAQLIALGHRPFGVGTGGVIPVFVKAKRTSERSELVSK